jgi:hypothetical protein
MHTQGPVRLTLTSENGPVCQLLLGHDVCGVGEFAHLAVEQATATGGAAADPTSVRPWQATGERRLQQGLALLHLDPPAERFDGDCGRPGRIGT